MSTEEIGIVSLEHKSCAALTVQCLADAGVADWQTAFDLQIENSKKMGLMPDDFKVIRETLKDFGFVMQNTRTEDIRVRELLNQLGALGEPAVIFIQVIDYMHMGGRMTAVRTDGLKYKQISPALEKADNIAGCRTSHVWIRWDDGVDRSPYPRKAVKRKKAKSSRRRLYEETESFRPFQPNPCGNYIGDCVVRAVSGVMDISWSEAVDRLASLHETTINARQVYPKILEQNGFIHHQPIVRNGRRLDGRSFCNEVGRVYSKGERIFAHVGRSHVAAVIPVRSDDNKRTVYKIIDSWDSSARTVGEYWVKQAKPAIRNATFSEQPEREFHVGEEIHHPAFGTGTIVAAGRGILTIDFGSNGLRRLGEAWVVKHCA